MCGSSSIAVVSVLGFVYLATVVLATVNCCCLKQSCLNRLKLFKTISKSEFVLNTTILMTHDKEWIWRNVSAIYSSTCTLRLVIIETNFSQPSRPSSLKKSFFSFWLLRVQDSLPCEGGEARFILIDNTLLHFLKS